MAQYVALLRGINVGGNNAVKMSELKTCFENLGMEQVRTYINSGNVLFRSKATSVPQLTRKIEAALAKEFTAKPPIVIKSLAEMQTIVDAAPKGWGSDAAHKHNCAFLKNPLTVTEALEKTPAKPGIDIVTAGPGVLYFSVLMSKATQSYMSKLVSAAIYKNMTLRNYNTTAKLLALMKND